MLATGSVISTNHTSASALGGGRSSRAYTTHSAIGTAPGHGRAGTAGRGVTQLVEQAPRDGGPLGRGVLAEDAVDLRTPQRLDVRCVDVLFDEQVEEVGHAVHGAHHAGLHHAGLGQVLGGLSAIAQPPPPTQRYDFLSSRGLVLWIGIAGFIALRGGWRRTRPAAPQRNPVGIDRKGRVPVQAAGERTGLVRANHPSPCVWPRRVKLKLVLFRPRFIRLPLI